MTSTRTYQRTHPFLTFGVDLRRAPWGLWALLGEARSKCEHIASTPLRPETNRELHMLYLAKGALATTAIEGNTLSEQEVVEILKGELKLPESKQYLANEINNIVAAVNQIAEEIRVSGSSQLSVESIKRFNKLVLKDLEHDAEVVPGELRTHSVGVGKYRAAPAEDCEYLLGRLCDWLNSPDFSAPTSHDQPMFAILKAVIAHVYLAWIHGFGDGNGRTARLVEFQILVSSGFPYPAAHLLSNHYNGTRAEYYRQLQRASDSGGDIIPFIEYAVRGFVDELRRQLEVIREQQFDIAWRNHIIERFESLTAPSDLRRRQLLLDLSQAPGPVPASQLRQLSARVAADYATKTGRTLIRDLRQLLDMGLVEWTKEGWKAKRTVILGFLPARVQRLQPPDAAPPLMPPPSEVPAAAALSS